MTVINFKKPTEQVAPHVAMYIEMANKLREGLTRVDFAESLSLAFPLLTTANMVKAIANIAADIKSTYLPVVDMMLSTAKNNPAPLDYIVDDITALHSAISANSPIISIETLVLDTQYCFKFIIFNDSLYLINVFDGGLSALNSLLIKHYNEVYDENSDVWENAYSVFSNYRKNVTTFECGDVSIKLTLDSMVTADRMLGELVTAGWYDAAILPDGTLGVRLYCVDQVDYLQRLFCQD